MAVYTQVSAEAAAKLLDRYDVGRLVSLKGIAEGVENSNYLLETDRARFILTLYESRVDPADLPYFHNLLAHLHNAGSPVPRFIDDRDGGWLQDVKGKKACLIEFLPGISVSEPTAAQAEAVGRSLARMHLAVADFAETKPNPLGQADWRPLFDRCDAAAADALQDGLAADIAAECDWLAKNWPSGLPQTAVHTDLFPDNVLFRGNDVGGLIDFYFACTDFRAYDLAVTHAAWSFSNDGGEYAADIGAALIAGYRSVIELTDAEKQAFPALARGAALRFLLTRLFDWINTPADALVTRKDPLAFYRRLRFYRRVASGDIFGATA
ncbi:homoserine kinase [Sphingorhabdus sp.]|jgi:homoserine kinase type II|uniref:homoserine kinase n=1 Tax=Sphingorhabdus sp. TaxID=1902408 RepID=UPI0035AD898B|nr:homoserine kinase [Sphingomonadaceae bacterium]